MLTRDKVKFRAWELQDTPVLQHILNHPQMEGLRYLPWKYSDHLPLSQTQAKEIIENWQSTEKGLSLAVTRTLDDAIIGAVNAYWEWDTHNISASLFIAAPYRRKGYGMDAAELLIDYLFQNTVAHNVRCWTPDWNMAGIEFIAALGFTRIGQDRDVGFHAGRFYCDISFDMLRPEWVARNREETDAA